MTSFSILKDAGSYLWVYKHPGTAVQGESFLNDLSEQCARRVYLCHRLDRDTSGLMLLATDSETAKKIQTAFENHCIQKTYFAIGYGKPLFTRGSLVGSQKKTRSGNYRFSPEKKTTAQGQYSLTHFVSHKISGKYRLYLLRPGSGRTHQLRCALQFLKSPVLGDHRYSKKEAQEAERMYLHAWALNWQSEDGDIQHEVLPLEGERWPEVILKQSENFFTLKSELDTIEKNWKKELNRM